MNNSSHSGGDSNLPATLNPPAEGGPPVVARRGSPARRPEAQDDSPTGLSLPEELEEDLTPDDDDPPQVVELRRTQQIAFAALAEGKSVTCAAARANVNRRTVHRWMRDDEDFQAALEACRVGTMDLVRRQLLAAAPRAAEKVAEATEQGDGKFAMALLKALGAFAGTSAPVDALPIDIDKEIERREQEWAESADPDVQAFTEQLNSLSYNESIHAAEIMKLGREVFARQQAEETAAREAAAWDTAAEETAADDA